MNLTIFKPGLPVRQITITAPSGARDAFGQSNSTWSMILTTRATIEDSSSLTFKYAFQNNVLASNATFAITLRCPSVDILPGMQAQYGDRNFVIQAVNDVDMRHFKLVLACVGQDIGSL
jgi:head-tail adaptor